VLFCFWTNRILFGSLLVGLPRIKQCVLLAVPRAPKTSVIEKSLFLARVDCFGFGFVLVIAPPKKDNTRTTHTHTMFAVQSSSICARSSSSCQLKTQKTTSSKRVQRCHHSAVRLFCFVLFCVYMRARRRVLLPSERERKESKFSPQ